MSYKNAFLSLTVVIILVSFASVDSTWAQTTPASNIQQVAQQYLKSGFKDLSNAQVAALLTELKKSDPGLNTDTVLGNFAAEKLAEGKSQKEVADAMMDIAGQALKQALPQVTGAGADTQGASSTDDPIDSPDADQQNQDAAIVAAAEEAAEKASEKAREDFLAGQMLVDEKKLKEASSYA